MNTLPKGNRYFLFTGCIFWIVGIYLLLSYSDYTLYYYINTHYSSVADRIMSLVTLLGDGWFISIVLLIILFLSRKRISFRFVISMILCNLIPALVGQLLKIGFKKPRPLALYKEEEWIHLVQDQPLQYHYSFPSGHTIGVFAFFCFLSLLLPGKWKLMGVFFFLLAAITGYSRIYLSQHFYSDVFAGSIIGTFTCLMVFKLFPPFKTN